METKTNYFSDSRNWAKLFMGGILGLAVCYGFFVILLPMLVSIVWAGISLVIGLTILALMVYVLISKGTWRRLGYLNAKLAKIFTFWIIEWDEFLIQEQAIEKAKKDRQIIKEQADNLAGQVAQKDDELREANKNMLEAKGMVQELQINATRGADDPELQLAVNEYTRQQEFVESISPLRMQIDELSKICMKVYADTGVKIKDAEAELKIQKAKLQSLTSGETAMNKAMSIFTGENPDVILAEQLVKQKIGAKIGSIRNTLEIISPIMNERALKDKVKMKTALAQLRATTDVREIAPPSNYNSLLNN